MRKPLALILSAVILFCTVAMGAPLRWSERKMRKAGETISGFVLSSMEAKQTPGLTLAVTTDKSLIYLGTYGYADLKAGAPVSEDTLFQIGSITKSFTALSLLRLHDEGRLNLKKSVQTYLPWFDVQSSWSTIQVHHLLSHSSGLPQNRDNLTHSPLMVAAISDQQVAWAPGERFHYSNIGYQTLHFLLEKLAEVPYREFVATNILSALGMNSSRPVITLESRSEQAVGYIPPFDDRPHHPSRSLVEAPHFDYWVGDGSIQSTATDMAAYVRMLLNKGQGPTGRVVSQDAFERFMTSYIPVGEDSGYGYGIRVSKSGERTILEHSGGMVGFVAFMQADLTSGLGAVVLANGPAATRRIAEYCLEVARAIQDEREILTPPEGTDPTNVVNATEYVGRFNRRSSGPISVVAEGIKLYVKLMEEKVILERRGKDTFLGLHPELDRYFLHFSRDDEGNVNRVTHGADLYWKEGKSPSKLNRSADHLQPLIGRFRSYSPWFSYFEVLGREGELFLVTGEGENRLVGKPGSSRLSQVAFVSVRRCLRKRSHLERWWMVRQWKLYGPATRSSEPQDELFDSVEQDALWES